MTHLVGNEASIRRGDLERLIDEQLALVVGSGAAVRLDGTVVDVIDFGEGFVIRYEVQAQNGDGADALHAETIDVQLVAP